MGLPIYQKKAYGYPERKQFWKINYFLKILLKK